MGAGGQDHGPPPNVSEVGRGEERRAVPAVDGHLPSRGHLTWLPWNTPCHGPKVWPVAEALPGTGCSWSAIGTSCMDLSRGSPRSRCPMLSSSSTFPRSGGSHMPFNNQTGIHAVDEDDHSPRDPGEVCT